MIKPLVPEFKLVIFYSFSQCLRLNVIFRFKLLGLGYPERRPERLRVGRLRLAQVHQLAQPEAGRRRIERRPHPLPLQDEHVQGPDNSQLVSARQALHLRPLARRNRTVSFLTELLLHNY